MEHVCFAGKLLFLSNIIIVICSFICVKLFFTNCGCYMFIIKHMFYGLHEKIDQTGDNKADIMRKNLESHIDVSIQKYYIYLEQLVYLQSYKYLHSLE